ncbi:hypothetical protein QUF94_17885 [Peribacillus sp. NJ4]|uniref:hypothetical protein n=1 Tax=Peribacillus TaxID=2675229 RepID=UPI0025A1529A|nr:hypothetical protein [Peribacillus sp. NJ4]MDM5213268.1 hypothetical protein [Peribacillus sp. NJ4]
MLPSRNNVRFLSISLLVLLFLSLTGYWSSHEIEDMNLIVGAAIDIGEESTDRGEYKKHSPNINLANY